MHRVLLGLESPGRTLQGDHKNGNGLDNRRENLRLATHAQNMHNRKGVAGSGLKGVYFTRRKDQVLKKPWQAFITPSNNVKVHLGYFATAEEAARAYDAAARDHFGSFAWLNFPDEPHEPSTMRSNPPAASA